MISLKAKLTPRRLSQTQRSRTRTKCYLDQVSLDYNNRSFYIYDIGKFDNTRIYYYGETLDLMNVEFRLCKVLPVYHKVVHVLMDSRVSAKDYFDKYVTKAGIKTTLMLKYSDVETWDAFVTNDDYTLPTILEYVNCVFAQENASS